MNLYLRLILALFRSWRQPKIGLHGVVERTMRVWPNDIDINGHMNNGRYLTIIDLMMIEYFVRVGFAKVLIDQGWRPMSGGAFITYRKQLQPGQKYKVQFRWSGANEHWNFMRFDFLRMDGTLCATGYMKGAAVSRKGLVRNEDSYALMKIDFAPGLLPEAVSNWLAAEAALIKQP
jgi:acyl-CoA thioesterase FadM